MPLDEPAPDDRDAAPATNAETSSETPTTSWVSPSPGAPAAGCPTPTGTWGCLEVLEQMGQGGFGRVYRARDPALARDVALKIIEVPAHDASRLADVLREGRLLARLRHPNVVTVYGAQESGGTVGIWMELIRGQTLADMVRRGGPFGPEEAIAIGISVCRALAAVHGEGLVHRDVKAQNVMRESGGRIVLMDFGASWDPQTVTRPRDVSPAGTPLYMAPELFAGQRPSVASDLYSVGVLLFFLVTGTYPVEGRTIGDVVLAHGLGQRRLLADCRPDLPDAFVRVVERALSPSPDHRFPTAGVMWRELDGALGPASEPVADAAARTPALARSEAPEQPSPQPVWWARPGPWLGIAGAAIGGIWLLGLFESLAFNLALSRFGGFDRDSVFDWWLWGLRSLFAPAVYVFGAVVVLRTAGFALRLLVRAARLGNVVARAGGRFRASASRLGLDNPIQVGQVLLVLQLAALAAAVWAFADLIAAFTANISTADAARLAPLDPGRFARRSDYRMLFPLLAFAMALAWSRVERWRWRCGITGDRVTVAAGIALIVIAVMLGQFPYRIFHHSEFQRVTFAGERCYVIGERGGELLLSCPDVDPPRNRVVASGDTRLERSSAVESVYTPRAAALGSR